MALGVARVAVMMSAWLHWRLLGERPRLPLRAVLCCLGAVLGRLIAALVIGMVVGMIVLLAEFALGLLRSGTGARPTRQQSCLAWAVASIPVICLLPLYLGLRLAPALVTAATGEGPGLRAAWRQTRPLRGTALLVSLACLVLAAAAIALMRVVPIPLVWDLAVALVLLLWIATLPGMSSRAGVVSRADVFA